MNIMTIPDLVWDSLAAKTLQLSVRDYAQQAFSNQLANFFYHQLYSKEAGRGAYANRTENGGIWKSFIEIFKSADNKPLASAFGADPAKLPKSIDPKHILNAGRAVLQIDATKNDEHNSMMARPYESYNRRKVVARFQFVVHSGGGIVLFNRMRRACQEYIHRQHGGDCLASVVSQWKVFGEEAQLGRSDSCVAYLNHAIDGGEVQALVRDYIWPNTADLVEADFKVMGMTKIGRVPIWGFDIPDETRESKYLGRSERGSAGGLMASVLGLAFFQAINTEEGKLVAQSARNDRAFTSSKRQLIPIARGKIIDLLANLYPD